jgi:uncharacterized protein YdeI (YjbR/CyaY-like superfamily)
MVQDTKKGQTEVMETLYVTDRRQWRSWLSEHHAAESEVWLLFYKKHTKKPTISYDDAVQEAICFGWIDSLARRIDDETYAQKFTPRTDPYNWSETNRKRARLMIEAGKMTPAGLETIKVDLESAGAHSGGTATGEAPVLPAHLEKLIRDNEKAWAGFAGLTDSQRRLYVRWIMSAKKEETRVRRVREAIGLLEQGKLLTMK